MANTSIPSARKINQAIMDRFRNSESIKPLEFHQSQRVTNPSSFSAPRPKTFSEAEASIEHNSRRMVAGVAL